MSTITMSLSSEYPRATSRLWMRTKGRGFVSWLAALLAVLVLAAGAAPVAAQCAYLRWVGGVFAPGNARGVAVAGRYAYIAGQNGGLHVIDVVNPASPVIVATLNAIADCRDVAVEGNYACVAAGNRGLKVVDITDPLNPAVVGGMTMPGFAEGVTMAGAYAYIMNWYGGLWVIDISNPAFPNSYSTTEGPAHAAAIAGNFAYVAYDYIGLGVIDLTVPWNPVVTGTAVTPSAYGVAVNGNHAYVADQYSGLVVVDVTNPRGPAIVGSAPVFGYAYQVVLAGNYAYVAASYGGLRAVDITNPATPLDVAGIATGGWAYDVALQGHYAYVADYYGGLQVVDIECPVVPVLFASIEATPDDRGVVLSWDLQADEPVSGFEVYRSAPGEADRRVNDLLLDPATRTLRDDEAEGGRTYDYFVVAVLPGGERIQSQRISVETQTLALALYPNRPNPFNPTTTISFALPERGQASLTIYDVKGNRVRRLVDEQVSSGLQEVAWDGRDDDGRVVGSGVYFYELRAGSKTLTRKMVLMK